MNLMFSILVNAFIVKGDRILISQRSLNEKHAAGMWTVPGGKIENDTELGPIFNMVEKTLVREVIEEVGIEITKDI